MLHLIKMARASGLLRLVPKHAKRWMKARLDFESIHQVDWEQSYRNALAGVQPVSYVTDQPVTIIYDRMLRHVHYEAACRELGVPYNVLDITSHDWLSKMTLDHGAIYFIRPFVLSSIGRDRKSVV